MTPAERKLILFAAAVIDQARYDGGGSIDGGWLQDKATEVGVLVPVPVREPCADGETANCLCAEYGEFPTNCYRVEAMVRRTIDAVTVPVKGGV